MDSIHQVFGGLDEISETGKESSCTSSLQCVEVDVGLDFASYGNMRRLLFLGVSIIQTPFQDFKGKMDGFQGVFMGILWFCMGILIFPVLGSHALKTTLSEQHPDG